VAETIVNIFLFLCLLNAEVNKLLDNTLLILSLLFILGIEHTREDKSCVAVLIWLVDIQSPRPLGIFSEYLLYISRLMIHCSSVQDRSPIAVFILDLIS